MPAKPKTIDDYLARVSATQQAALEKLRRDIKAAAPAAEECISYDIPGYRLGLRLLVSFGAAKTIAPSIPVLNPSGQTRTSLPDMISLKARSDFRPTNRFPPDS